ncbi:MAG: hypothetical protein R2875_11650 [Desulfobacterales bacterium]
MSSIENLEKVPEKEPERDRVPLQKCEKCGKDRPVKMFETTEKTTDSQKNWCAFCRRQHDGLRRKTAGNIHFYPQGPKGSPAGKTRPAKNVFIRAARDFRPNRDQAEDFDYTEYLLESETLKRKLSRDILKIPKQITKIKARTRVCNGCKTEELDQVERTR